MIRQYVKKHQNFVCGGVRKDSNGVQLPSMKHRQVILSSNRLIFRNLRLNFSTKISTADSISKYEGVVGLEVHAQISSKSKLFSSSPVEFGAPTNTKVSFFDAAFPGTLPVLNKSCVEAGILTALALNCTVNKISTFDRKHYFYPDLPAGFQITQQFKPLASNGYIKFVVHGKTNNSPSYECIAYLKQIQLEQDSGRSFHVKGAKSLIDLNRAGIGLMELVFEPNLKNGTEAAALVKALISVLKQIGTCTCEMEEGTLRVDANVSVNKIGEPFGVRTEVKNINSLRYIARAVDYEMERQIKIIENGGLIVNETRAYDYSSKKTIFMRDKEILQDYRFMPEPNLPPIRLYDNSDKDKLENCDNVLNIDDFQKRLPVLPEKERETLICKYKLPLNVADRIVHSSGFMKIFKVAASRINDYSSICNFLFLQLGKST
ncbi:glutamyl-tRNA(Gln) amidotransferase subunit B, mitochondrial [Caerostris extrusa]|uniref:Glutamyl-tRNA(Gln) amidotransferase subunit B, mitochondrial n=1 Tax=Caerostris extrusa TaxID=172846 RepID=A0AAV4SKD0_CAEEX|nr:glutamyl-tRNA(Gln) amidotransferase subunit B, mitochondrial [Caerostris extrusa]